MNPYHPKILSFLVLFFHFGLMCSLSQQAGNINQTDIHGHKTGLWEGHYPSGELRYTGRFIDDQPTGEFIYYYESGALRATNQFSLNGRKAYNKVYSEQGILLNEGVYFDQKKDSIWRVYSDTDGKLIAEEQYQNDLLHGPSKVYYPGNGQLAELTSYENGIKQGEWKRWFEDGSILNEANYVNDQLDGKAVFYHPNGAIEQQGYYHHGQKAGLWQLYDEQGLLLEEEEYKLD